MTDAEAIAELGFSTEAMHHCPRPGQRAARRIAA